MGREVENFGNPKKTLLGPFNKMNFMLFSWRTVKCYITVYPNAELDFTYFYLMTKNGHIEALSSLGIHWIKLYDDENTTVWSLKSLTRSL